MNEVVSLPSWLTEIGDSAQAKSPDWIQAIRKKNASAFLATGLPTRKNERWKYTDLTFLKTKNFSKASDVESTRFNDLIQRHRLRAGENILLVFVNGYFKSEISDLAKLPTGVIACHLAEATEKHAALIRNNLSRDIDANKYPFASLNSAMSTDGLFLYIPDHCELSSTIHLLSIMVDEHEAIAHPRHTIILGEQSKLTLVDEYYSMSSHSYLTNVVTSIDVGKQAQLEMYKLQQEGMQAVHMSHTFVFQKKDSQVTAVGISTGGAFSRDDVVVQLLEKGADCKTSGFYYLNHDEQYIDYHIDINHAAPRSNSEMLYKGILEKKSRAVFNGRLSVEKDAQKILAYQANHNLLLSAQAEVNSKPELEIYADDVKCKHGATTGQIDQEALFYMRSRGIPASEAMHILLQGFAEEVTQRVTHPGVQLRVQEMVMFL